MISYISLWWLSNKSKNLILFDKYLFVLFSQSPSLISILRLFSIYFPPLDFAEKRECWNWKLFSWSLKLEKTLFHTNFTYSWGSPLRTRSNSIFKTLNSSGQLAPNTRFTIWPFWIKKTNKIGKNIENQFLISNSICICALRE